MTPVKKVRKKSRVTIEISAGAPTIESLDALLRDLRTIADTHPELHEKMYQVIGWLLLPDGFIWQQQGNREWMRHLVARHNLERGNMWDSGVGGGAFQMSADELHNHPAAVKPDRIEAAYKKIESKLPPELQRVQEERRRGRKRKAD
jgi:hypothetical protein